MGERAFSVAVPHLWNCIPLSYNVDVIKLMFYPKKETHVCVFNTLYRRMTWLKKIKFVQILPHVWVDLDIAGEHLDIIRNNNKNSDNLLR